MPQQLEDLTIEEISLVDFGANSEVINGRKVARSRVAIFKRDDPGYLSPAELRKHMDDLESERKLKETKTMSTFQKVMKSATTRDQIVAGVQTKAQKIAKRDGIAPEVALAKVWEAYPEARQRWESAPVEVVKRDPKMMSITKSEVELDKRARKLMKGDPTLSYARACAKALESDPSLYSDYEKDLLDSNRQYLVPDAGRQGSDSPMAKAAAADDDDDADEDAAGYCAKCSKKLRKADRFCPGCGTDCMKEKSRKRSA